MTRYPIETPYCDNDCGRRVWHFDSGLCARCDPRTSNGGRGKRRTEPYHGTRARYRSGCRCDRCRAVNAHLSRRFRRNKNKNNADYKNASDLGFSTDLGSRTSSRMSRDYRTMQGTDDDIEGAA